MIQGPGGRITCNKRVQRQSDSFLNALELHREFTEEESVKLITEDERYYVASLSYQEPGNGTEMKFDKYFDSYSNVSSEEESQLEQEEED